MMVGYNEFRNALRPPMTDTKTPPRPTQKVDKDPLSKLSEACSKADGDCPGRTHFILHQTVGINKKGDILKYVGERRSKSHGYLLKDGEFVPFWPFAEENVWGTKAESEIDPENGVLPTFSLAGKAINIEIDYEEGGKPNDKQYETLAGLYVSACQAAGRILTIVPHIEVDRGIKGAHSDPQDFNYNHFYDLLKGRGIDLARVPRFDHDRYWGKPAYKISHKEDVFHWPPRLSGNPHAKD